MVERITLPQRDFFVSSAPAKAQNLGLQKGGKVLALVQNVTESGVQLQINGREVQAATQVPLQSGQQLLLEVEDVEQAHVILRVLDANILSKAPHAAGASQSETQRLALNLLRLLNTEAGASLLSRLSAFIGQIQDEPDDFNALLSRLPQSSQNSLVQGFQELMQTLSLTEGTPEEIAAQLKLYFQQFSDAPSRGIMLKTLFSLQSLLNMEKDASAAPALTNTLLGTQLHNGLAQLSHASPFFFLIPVVIHGATVPLEVYYYKEKSRRGKSPREKTHLVLLLTLPNIGTIKIHVLAVMRALSIMIASPVQKIKVFLSKNTDALTESLQGLGFTVENLDVRVEKKPAIPFSLAREIQKQLSLKHVNVQA